MIKPFDRLVNQLLGTISIDRADKSVIRVNFDQVLNLLYKFDLFVPPKALENTLNKVIEERMVGKLNASDVTKWVLAQAILNTALSIAVSKEELLKIKLRDAGFETISRKK